MIVFSILGWGLLMLLILWRSVLTFRKNWVFRLGERIHFLMPNQAFWGKQMLAVVFIGLLIISGLVWSQGTALLNHGIIASAIWTLNTCYAATVLMRLVTVRPDRICIPFRMNCTFDRVQEIHLAKEGIDFKLGTTSYCVAFPSLMSKRETKTVVALMETLNMTATLQKVRISGGYNPLGN